MVSLMDWRCGCSSRWWVAVHHGVQWGGRTGSKQDEGLFKYYVIKLGIFSKSILVLNHDVSISDDRRNARLMLTG